MPQMQRFTKSEIVHLEANIQKSLKNYRKEIDKLMKYNDHERKTATKQASAEGRKKNGKTS